MSYRKKSPKPWLVVRKQGNHPVSVVAGTHFPSKKRTQKKAKELNRAYEGSDIKFMVREEGWRRKRWHS